jgi:hypothetical protein
MNVNSKDGLVEVQAHGVTWRALPEFADVLRALDIDKVRHPERLAPGELIKDNKVRTVARLPHPANPNGPSLFIKRYKLDNLTLKLKHLVVATHAFKEWKASRALAAIGIPTFKVLAFSERRCLMLPCEAMLITLEIPRVLTLRQWTMGGGWRAADRKLKNELIEEVSEIIVRMVRAGISHGDLHLGNLLIDVSRPAGKRLSVVDLHRVRLGSARRHGLVRMFRFLAAPSAKYGVGSADRLRVMRRVLTELRAPEALSHDELRWWVRRVNSSWRKQQHRYLRQQTRLCLTECAEFARDITPDFRVWRKRSFPLADALALVRCHEETMQGRGPGRVAKRGGRAQVTICPASDGRTVCVKAYGKQRKADHVRDMLGLASRARAAWTAHRGLLVRGVPTAEGLALLESTRGGQRPDYVIVEAVQAEGRLDEVAPKLTPGGREVRALARAVAKLFRKLADMKVGHPDTKATNVLVARQGDDWRLWLVDLDGVKFGKKWTMRKWLKSLSQCNMKTPLGLGVIDRMRCLREIGRGRWTAQERLRLARRVLEVSRRGDNVWGIQPTGQSGAGR